MGRRPEAVVSEVMRRVRARDTSPEKALRKALWARGLRYRLHCKRLPGNPDIVLSSRRVAVFVDGDFWHGNQWKLRGFPSLEAQFEGSTSAGYWVPKIRRNMERDAVTDKCLGEMGWRVIRCWESDIRKDINSCVQRVVEAIQ